MVRLQFLHHLSRTGTLRASKLAGCALGFVIAFAAPAEAACWGPNEGSYASLQNPSAVYDGFRGNQYVPISPSLPIGRAIAHPAQISFLNNNFVGIGTYKGDGAEGAGGNCSDGSFSSGSVWKVFRDYGISGVYGCSTQTNTEAAGNSPSYELSYGSCGGVTNGWRLYWRGSLKSCLATGATAAFILGWGGEAPNGTADLNIDVGYRSTQYNSTSSTTWTTASASSANYYTCFDPSYSIRSNGSGSWDAYLNPFGS